MYITLYVKNVSIICIYIYIYFTEFDEQPLDEFTYIWATKISEFQKQNFASANAFLTKKAM